MWRFLCTCFLIGFFGNLGLALLGALFHGVFFCLPH